MNRFHKFMVSVTFGAALARFMIDSGFPSALLVMFTLILQIYIDKQE